MMWKALLPGGLAVLLAVAVTPARGQDKGDVRDLFRGQGQIHVLNSSDFNTASPADRIGCFNEHGLLTLNDCAVFTHVHDQQTVADWLTTSVGNCSFKNPNMPKNTDSYYGSDTVAWSCVDSSVVDFVPGGGLNTGEHYYTINGFKYPFVCNGNINCWYDIFDRAPTDADPLPVWQFFWGGHQTDVPPGHRRVMWLWVPV